MRRLSFMSDNIGSIELDDLLGLASPREGVNRQLYENGHQAGGEVETKVTQSQHGYRTPNLNIQTEKPEHRVIIYLKAQGKSNKEIAELTGYTQSWVSQILRQPWARLRVLQIINEQGGDAVQQLLQSSTLDSVQTLIDLRDDAKAPASVRATAASQLLDRVLGKPVQHIESVNRNVPVSSEYAMLEQQLKGVEDQLKRFGVN